RRKLAILANAAFGARLSDEVMIPAEGISAITSEDIGCARAFGMRVKLIAHARLVGEGWHGWVHPAAVAPSSPLYGVARAFNAILLAGDFIGQAMFYGPGAGSYPTASAVVGDVIDVAQHLDAAKPRIERASAPAFRPPQDGEPMRLLTSALTAGGNREAIARALPGAEMRDVGALTALLTPPLPLNDAIGRLNELSGRGVKFGSVLYVTDENA
ncbi:MAG: hypothetical protein GX558_06830, partial [Clostridiales bacterium]|nr:hypothetical protein [Clostridiales bacterium]